MTRKKKDKAAANGDQPNGAGHNKPELTEDERRALTYAHRADWERAEATVKAATAARKAVEDLAKSELGKGAVADIKELILLDMPKGNEALHASIERSLRLARWANAPVGAQFSFDVDRRPETDRAFENGKTAGLKGEPKKAPHDHSVPQHDAWCNGWDTGYGILMSDFRSKMKPMNEKPAAEGEQMDLAARGDLPPAGEPFKPDTSDVPFKSDDIPTGPPQPQ